MKGFLGVFVALVLVVAAGVGFFEFLGQEEGGNEGRVARVAAGDKEGEISGPATGWRLDQGAPRAGESLQALQRIEISEASATFVAQNFAELWQAAQIGDVEIARLITKALGNCRAAPANLPSLESKLQLIRRSDALTSAMRFGLISSEKERFERCGLFSAQQRALEIDSVLVAAKAGDEHSLLKLGLVDPFIGPDPTGDEVQHASAFLSGSLSLLQQRVEAGEIEYLGSLARVASRSALLGQGDPALAYAYLLAADARANQLLRMGASGARVESELALLRAMLDPEQIEAAEQRALALLGGQPPREG